MLPAPMFAMSDGIIIAWISSGGIVATALFSLVSNLVGKDKLRDSKAAIDFTRTQLTPNSGSSLRDAIDRIDERTAIAERRELRLEARLDAHSRDIKDVSRRITHLESKVVEIPQKVKEIATDG